MMNLLEFFQNKNVIVVIVLLVVLGLYFRYRQVENLEPVSNELADNLEAQFGPADTTVDATMLPSYENVNEFDKENQVSNILKERKLLIAGKHSGVDTVVQTNKLPYHDIRSAPAIVKEDVSPFLQSSYEQPMGAGRRKFVIS